MVAVGAAMEGQAAVLATIGGKVVLSEGELVVLCNLAHMGLLTYWTHSGSDAEAAETLAEFQDAATKRLARADEPNGMKRLIQAGAAALSQAKFYRYIFQAEDQENQV